MLVREFIKQSDLCVYFILFDMEADRPLFGVDRSGKQPLPIALNKAQIEQQYPEYLDCEITHWSTDSINTNMFLFVTHKLPASVLLDSMRDLESRLVDVIHEHVQETKDKVLSVGGEYGTD